MIYAKIIENFTQINTSRCKQNCNNYFSSKQRHTILHHAKIGKLDCCKIAAKYRDLINSIIYFLLDSRIYIYSPDERKYYVVSNRIVSNFFFFFFDLMAFICKIFFDLFSYMSRFPFQILMFYSPQYPPPPHIPPVSISQKFSN